MSAEEAIERIAKLCDEWATGSLMGPATIYTVRSICEQALPVV